MATVVPPAASMANGDADVLAELGGESSMTVLDLVKTFDKPNTTKRQAGCFRMCLAVASKSGKAWLVVELIHLLQQTRLITDVVVFSPTAALSHDFDAVVPPDQQFHSVRLSCGRLSPALRRPRSSATTSNSDSDSDEDL